MIRKKKICDYLKSLKFRLLLVLLLFGLAPMLFMQFFVIRGYEKRAINVRMVDILSQSKILADQIASYGYLEDNTNEVVNKQFEQLSNIYDGRILVIDQAFQIHKDTYDIDSGKIIISEEVVKCVQGQDVTKYDPVNGFIEVAVPVRQALGEEVIGVMLVSVSTDVTQTHIAYLTQIGFIVSLTAGVVCIVLAVLISSLLAQPFIQLSKSIDEIQAGYGEDELMIHTYSETELICERTNELLDRMKVLDDSRQEFVSNVSHELKTPLTSMKVLADSLNMQENVPLELYKEFMQDITNEIDRENKIITDLLSLVKMDKAADSLNIAALNINDLLELILKRLRPIAEKQHIELVMESFRPVTAEVDEVKLTLAISNLVENAIKYNSKNGWVHVSLNADHQFFYIKVEDNGIGIPEESLDRIFERFYRVDKSHSKEIGGTGLGLAITRSVVLMHRGAIKAFSTEGEGTIFNVRIPLNYIGLT
ncbi:MAG: cell wall metabolism sensor histidine kinase WalK [Eubacterium sp.]|nr:cell wall metabolism sensor histidine kinase WalK [Eubacterium sp.]MCI8918337.1 cell wall metabolism sensor histidine kinase WalK [Eubacterium sp.]